MNYNRKYFNIHLSNFSFIILLIGSFIFFLITELSAKISVQSEHLINTPLIEYPYIQKVYALYDAEHKIENVLLSAQRHDYGYSKRTVMCNFFSHHMQLNTRGVDWEPLVNEKFVTILPSLQLQVFTEDNQTLCEEIKI